MDPSSSVERKRRLAGSSAGIIAAVLTLLLVQRMLVEEPPARRVVGSPDLLVFAMISQDPGDGGDNSEVFVMSSTGGEASRLTDRPGPDHSPAWSSDRSRIAFVSDRDDPGNLDIYTMAADGSDVRRVTRSPAIEGGPVWSHDDTLIAYEQATEVGGSRILVAPIDGSSSAPLTPAGLDAIDPSWSPDGSTVAFVANESGRVNVYVIDVGNGRVERITDGSEPIRAPQWSADGRRLIVLTSVEGETRVGQIDPNDREVTAADPVVSDAQAFEGVTTIAVGPRGESIVGVRPHIPGLGALVIAHVASGEVELMNVSGRLLSGVDW